MNSWYYPKQLLEKMWIYDEHNLSLHVLCLPLLFISFLFFLLDFGHKCFNTHSDACIFNVQTFQRHSQMHVLFLQVSSSQGNLVLFQPSGFTRASGGNIVLAPFLPVFSIFSSLWSKNLNT